MANEEKIRVFERDILDKVYLKKELINYSGDVAIPYLLQTYGDIVRHKDMLLQNGFTEVSFNTYITNLLHGIGHCIRWINNHKSAKYDSISDFKYAHQLASDFASWGTGYHMIAQEFVAWSRKIKVAELDEESKTISFILPDNYDYSQIFHLQGLYRKQTENILESYPQEEINLEYLQWLNEIKPIKPPIASSIKWNRAKSSSIYPLFLSKMEEIIFPELPEITDLGGYNLRNLRCFYSLFFLTFSFILWIENQIDNTKGVNNSYGSNPLYLNRHQFIQLALDTTDLNASTVQNIIDDLTFDHSNFHTSLSIQPFAKSNTGTYYILPNIFAMMEPSRMILGAFNKGKKRKIYDNLIGKIEKEALNRLASQIKQTAWVCYVEKHLKRKSSTISPDIILIDPPSKSLVVIDYKHFIGPITASEVIYKMSEITKAFNQVIRYVEFIRQLDKIDQVEIMNYHVSGMILTHKPLPIPTPINESIFISNSVSFMESIQNNRNVLLIDFIESLRPDTLFNEHFEPVDESIMVEEWKIVRKGFKLKR